MCGTGCCTDGGSEGAGGLPAGPGAPSVTGQGRPGEGQSLRVLHSELEFSAKQQGKKPIGQKVKTLIETGLGSPRAAAAFLERVGETRTRLAVPLAGSGKVEILLLLENVLTW